MIVYSASYFIFWFLDKQILSEKCLEKSSFIENKTALAILDYCIALHLPYPSAENDVWKKSKERDNSLTVIVQVCVTAIITL